MKGKYIALLASMCVAGSVALSQAAAEQMAVKSFNDQTIAAAHKEDNLYSPVGYWLQYTDDGKQAQSILQVYKGKGGKLEGKIIVPFVNLYF